MKNKIISVFKRNFIVGVVIILLLSLTLSFEFINSFAISTNKHSNNFIRLVEDGGDISSSDAKFMGDHIIAGVKGTLTIMNVDRSVVKQFPEIKAVWLDSLDEEGLIIYGNNSNEIGIVKLSKKLQGNNVSYEVVSNNIICKGNNTMIDPTIIHVRDYYYITFTEIIGKGNNENPFKESEAPKINGEYILHMWRIKIDSNLGDKNSWEEVSVIQDNFHNTEDIDILYSDDHFTVLFEYENYDKGCSAIKAIQSLDSEGYKWGKPIELLPNDSDHEMASVWDEGDHYTLWYSCDKEEVGKSYMAGRIYYAEYDKDWNLWSRDNEIKVDYSVIGGVRLYEVTRIDGAMHFLYAKDYLTANKLTVLKEEIWKCNSKGWWVEFSDGSYPVNMWQKIDGVWYYFDESGYMVSGEWREGYWLSVNGALEYNYTASWKNNSSGWWYEDGSGWYPVSSWQKIDGCWYYFDNSGYIVTNQYVDGYWLGADGKCQ